MKAPVKQEKTLVGAFSVIVQLGRLTALPLVATDRGGPLFFLLFVLPRLTTIVTNIQNFVNGLGRKLPVAAMERVEELSERLQAASKIKPFTFVINCLRGVDKCGYLISTFR